MDRTLRAGLGCNARRDHASPAGATPDRDKEDRPAGLAWRKDRQANHQLPSGPAEPATELVRVRYRDFGPTLAREKLIGAKALALAVTLAELSRCGATPALCTRADDRAPGLIGVSVGRILVFEAHPVMLIRRTLREFWPSRTSCDEESSTPSSNARPHQHWRRKPDYGE